MQAITPFAIVLPKDYVCIEIPEPFETNAYAEYKLGNHRDVYMRSPLNASEKSYFGHIEDVLKLIYDAVDMCIPGTLGYFGEILKFPILSLMKSEEAGKLGNRVNDCNIDKI